MTHRSIIFKTMTHELSNIAHRAARCLRASAIELLGFGALLAVQPAAVAADQFTGKGQTIVVLTKNLGSAFKTAYAREALNGFSRFYRLPECNAINPCFEVVDLAPSNIQQSASQQRKALASTQIAHYSAPGAKIVLMVMEDGQESAVAAKIEALTPTAVSIIWTAEETSQQASMASTNCLCDGFFAKHPEIAFFGAVPTATNLAYPSTSPYVTAVSSAVVDSYSGSEALLRPVYGFGFSTVEEMPQFQKNYLTNDGSSLLSTKRAIPDVSYSGQDFGGYDFIDEDGGGMASPGPHVATSRWAGLAALLGEALQEQSYSLAELLRASNGLNNLLYATDVAKEFDHLSRSGFRAETGLGVPDVAKLLPALRSRVPLVGSVVQGTPLNPLMSIRSPSGKYKLKMQPDGNLVLTNQTGSTIWSTGTGIHPGAHASLGSNGFIAIRSAKGELIWEAAGAQNSGMNKLLTLQDDGNLVIYKPDAYWWNSGTYLSAYASTSIPPLGSPVWPAGTVLTSGQFIQSANGENKLIMQPDGNLVLYRLGKAEATWHSGSWGHSGAFAKMQADGNLVVYAANGGEGIGNNLWHSYSYGHPGASALVQDDGNVVVYTWTPIWSSNTVGK